MHKIKKIEIDLKREISYIINSKVKDPRIGFITITDVELSPDYRWLNVFVSIMGDKKKVDETFEGLKKCSGFIKKSLKGRVRLRNIPKMNFVYDNSVDRGMKITEILEDLNVNRES